MDDHIAIPRKLVHAVALGLGVVAIAALFVSWFSAFDSGRSERDTASLMAGSREKFAYLSGQAGPRSVGST